MWWRDRPALRSVAKLAASFAVAGLVAGCFQPLYGARGPGSPALREKLASVEIEPIAAPKGSRLERLAVMVQNELSFGLTGGAGKLSPTHRLKITLISNRSAVVVDYSTGRPEFESANVDAVYVLTELATGKVILTENALSRATYDIPGQQQRFAKIRGLADAEERASRTIADQIKNRLQSYFFTS